MSSFLNCLIQTSLTEWWISSRNLQSMVRPSHGENSPNNDGLTIHKLVEHLITPSRWAVGMCLTPLTSLKMRLKKLGLSQNRQPPSFMVCDHIPHEHGYSEAQTLTTSSWSTGEHGSTPLNDVSFFKNGLGWDAKALVHKIPSCTIHVSINGTWLNIYISSIIT